MIDFDIQLRNALNTVLPTIHELALNKNKTPCISYQETNNYSVTDPIGATLGYSRITYQVKVWGHSLKELNQYARQVDEVLRPLGFKRIACGELHDNNSTMIQKILTFEALASEEF